MISPAESYKQSHHYGGYTCTVYLACCMVDTSIVFPTLHLSYLDTRQVLLCLFDIKITVTNYTLTKSIKWTAYSSLGQMACSNILVRKIGNVWLKHLRAFSDRSLFVAIIRHLMVCRSSAYSSFMASHYSSSPHCIYQALWLITQHASVWRRHLN